MKTAKIIDIQIPEIPHFYINPEYNNWQYEYWKKKNKSSEGEKTLDYILKIYMEGYYVFVKENELFSENSTSLITNDEKLLIKQKIKNPHSELEIVGLYNFKADLLEITHIFRFKFQIPFLLLICTKEKNVEVISKDFAKLLDSTILKKTNDELN